MTVFTRDDKCPHIKTLIKGEEGVWYCRLTERSSGRIQNCVLMSGEECKTWEEIKKGGQGNDNT